MVKLKNIEGVSCGWRTMMLHVAMPLLAGLSLVLLPVAPARAANITAQLDRDHIVQGETVTLIIQTDDPQQSLEGDFAALAPDFELLDQRSETQMSIVNGSQSAMVRLIITLEPRRTGALTIPPLRFGSLTTPPLSLTVDAAPEPKPGEAPTVFIEVEVEPKDGPYYVHAQLLLTVRVFYQQSLTEAAISQPEPAPAAVRLLDEVPFQAERGGERYRVLERHYAVFPERSGPLVIPPMTLSGRLVERRSDKLWQPAVRGRRIEVSSDPVELTINPKPAAYSGAAWIPARALELSQTVSSGDSLTVGEPVTRTIMVDAVGLEENMVTAPAWPDIPDARIYPDQPQGISRNDGKWVLGHKEFRYAVVPEIAGELVLPELQLDWWDTRNNRQQTAVLPEQRLRVQPSSAVPAPPPAPVASAADLAPASPPQAPAAEETGLWNWLTFLFAALWLITLATGALLLPRRGPRMKKTRAAEMPANESAVLGRLEQACRNGEAGQARRALGHWLREFGPAGGSGSMLEFVRHNPDEALSRELLMLDEKGFRPDVGAAWNGRELWQAFSAWRGNWRAWQKHNQPGVTDLYAPARASRGR
jgi:hypothetical protein